MQIEINARTVAEAIAKAEEQLGVSREEMHILVLSEGKTGLFGLGSEEARIKVSVPEPIITQELPKETTIVAKEVLDKLLTLMGIAAKVNVHQNISFSSSDEPLPVVLDISGEDLGVLIGRRGETLAALQFIVNLVVSKRLGQHSHITVDVEGYRMRREQSLKGLAVRMAERVKTLRQPVTLEPMPPNERRIIHLALQGNAFVSTYSVGEGDERKVVISPKSAAPTRSGSR